jgi:hypothetical protein
MKLLPKDTIDDIGGFLKLSCIVKRVMEVIFKRYRFKNNIYFNKAATYRL